MTSLKSFTEKFELRPVLGTKVEWSIVKSNWPFFVSSLFTIAYSLFTQKKGPGRNPGRVLNPISYEKPIDQFSIWVPKAVMQQQRGFQHDRYSRNVPEWENKSIDGNSAAGEK